MSIDEVRKQKMVLLNAPPKPKFKVGDVVQCIGNSRDEGLGGDSAGWEKGLKFTVNRISGYYDADPIY